MSQTPEILDAVVDRLKERFGKGLAVELFPENPKGYRMNHPVGAILVAFSGSRFAGSDALDAVFQERDMTIPLTLVFRQLNGPQGVVGYLDQIREALTGFTPPHCCIALAPTDESFIGQVTGLWQYAQKYQTRTTQAQVQGPESGPSFKPFFEDLS
ncbi:Gp37 family protein [Acinetobacter baumannii]